MIRALFLDAAGTLIEPAEPVAAVYARHAAAHGHPLEPAAVKQAFGSVFASLPAPDWAAHAEGDQAERAWWRQVVHLTLRRAGAGPVLSDTVADRCFEALFRHYADPAAWRVFPEVPEVLARAAAQGWRCAVVSNFDRRLHGILAGHGLRFDAVVTSADAAARKPDPAIFRHALRLLGLAPAEALHLGDSPAADGHGAAAAGIPCRVLDRPDHDLLDLLAPFLDSPDRSSPSIPL